MFEGLKEKVTENWKLYTFFITATLLDSATTTIALSKPNIGEANPFIAGLLDISQGIHPFIPLSIWPLLVLTLLTLRWATVNAEYDYIYRILLKFGAVIQLAAATNNALLTYQPVTGFTYHADYLLLILASLVGHYNTRIHYEKKMRGHNMTEAMKKKLANLYDVYRHPRK